MTDDTDTVTARFDGEPMEVVELTDEGGEWTYETDDDRTVEVTIRWNYHLFTHSSAHVDSELVALDLESTDETEFVFEPIYDDWEDCDDRENDDHENDDCENDDREKYEFQVTLAWPDDADVDKQ